MFSQDYDLQLPCPPVYVCASNLSLCYYVCLVRMRPNIEVVEEIGQAGIKLEVGRIAGVKIHTQHRGLPQPVWCVPENHH